MGVDVLNKLRETKQSLRNDFGIEKIAVFGSYSRSEEKEKSDIDLVVMSMQRKNSFTLLKAKKFLESYLNKEVDLGLYDAIRPFIKKRIEKDLIYVSKSI